MRINLIIFLMTLVFLHVSASVDAQQKITLTLKEADIKQVFEAIEKQSGYGFWFQKEQLTGARKVTLRLQDVSLKEALDECFKGQPLTYEIVDRTIVVRVKAVPVAPAKVDESSRATVRGQVTDMKAVPLVGVSVRIKGTNTGTITDVNGRYSIDGNSDGTVVFSYIGYQTLEIKINGQSVIDITMVGNDTQLDQVQVIAYGTTSRRLSTGNIGSVKAEEIARQPVSNPLLALQGRVPGIYVQQQNGIPGGNVTVRIQGQNSLTKGSDPFYVVDGVPFSSDQLPGQSSAIRGGSGSPLNFLSPNDIESIEVLKDADATSIYGSRAANGAILITTKKGVVGATKLDLNLQTGWSKVPHFVDLMNTQQYIEIRREGKRNDNDQNFSQDYDINGTWDTTRYTDWQKQLIGHTAKYTNLQATISGGNISTQFLVGAGLLGETTVFYGGNDLPNYKGAVNFKVNHASPNKRFSLQFSGNYVNIINNIPSRDLTFTAWSLPPNAPELFNPDGNINWEPLANGTTTFNNPMVDLLQKYKVNTNNIIGNLLASYSIIPGLDFKSSFGYTNLYGNDISTVPISSFRPDAIAPVRSSRNSTNSNIGWIIEPQLQFKKHFKLGILDALVGSTFQDNKRDFIALTASGYTSDEQLENLAVASTITVSSAVQSRYKYNALFARINYTLDEKYFLNVTARRDGSSRFGPKNLFNNFASMGVAWVFSEEEFLRQRIAFLSFGKIKVSYGTTGNDQIGEYQFLNLYDKVTAVVPYQGVIGLTPQGHANPYLQWEETKKINIGLDLGFLDDKILVGTNYYRNQSSNQLLTYILPIQTGFLGVQSNFPAVIRNTGLELQFDVKILTNKNFSWNSGLNFTISENKLVSFPGLESNSSYSNRYEIGKPITGQKVYQYAGVNSSKGLYEVFNAKGDRTSTPSSLSDQTAFINTTPRFYGGVSNQLQYKGLEINMFFQFVSLTQSNASMRFGGTSKLGAQNNMPFSLLNRWQNTGDIVNVQRASTTVSAVSNALFAASGSNEAYADASFLRLKNVSISYKLPRELFGDILKYEPRIYLQGQNLYTLTNYPGFDPENGSAAAVPPLRTISAGFQITF